jgi:hypothetical protein
MMRTVASIFCAVALLACRPQAPTDPASLISFEEKGWYGYRNTRGTVVIPPKYSIASAFSPEGVAFVAGDGGWACINTDGQKLLTPFIFDNGPDELREGLFRYVQDEKMGFADSSCQVAVQAIYDFVLPFQEGLAVVCNACKKVPVPNGEHFDVQSGTWGYIDKTGALLIPLRFTAAQPFENGRATVTQGDKQIVIDTKGKPIVP